MSEMELSMTETRSTRVAIVGAGLAGLSAAYTLQKYGAEYVLFEANAERVGGRVWSAQFANGQTGEHGAERIDTRHTDLIALANELGLALDDHEEQFGDGSQTIIRYRGETRRDHEVAKERMGVGKILSKEIAERKIVFEQGDMAGTANKEAIEFDSQSVRDWVQSHVPGGATSPAGASLLSDVATLTGREANEVSSMALLDEWHTLVGFLTGEMDDPENLADARYRVRGGNGKIAESLRAALDDDRVLLGHRLIRILRNEDATYTLDFAGGSRVIADRVILALPYPALRRVDISEAGFSKDKHSIIREFEMGAVTKMLLQFNGRLSDFGLWNGFFFNDSPRFTSFESTGQQTGDTTVLTVYFGGAIAATLPVEKAHGDAPPAVYEPVLDALEAALPGIRARFTGETTLDVWSDDEYIHGAYSVFRPGQYTRFLGIIGEPEGGVFFAGEHTSKQHHGFMNGAVESGIEAATAVMADLSEV